MVDLRFFAGGNALRLVDHYYIRVNIGIVIGDSDRFQPRARSIESRYHVRGYGGFVRTVYHKRRIGKIYFVAHEIKRFPRIQRKFLRRGGSDYADTDGSGKTRIVYGDLLCSRARGVETAKHVRDNVYGLSAAVGISDGHLTGSESLSHGVNVFPVRTERQRYGRYLRVFLFVVVASYRQRGDQHQHQH